MIANFQLPIADLKSREMAIGNRKSAMRNDMLNKTIEIAPSILSADFSCLGEQIKAVERGGAGVLHVDVMDGHFVPNITIGLPVVKSLSGFTRLPIDAHLMITDPGTYATPC